MKFFYFWLIKECYLIGIVLLFPLIAVLDVLRGLINPDSLPFSVIVYGESVFVMYLYWIVIFAVLAGAE